MKKIGLLFIILFFTTKISFAVDCVNYNTSSAPYFPSGTIYVGDNGTFGWRSWATDGGNWGRGAVYIYTSSNIQNGIAGSYSSYSDKENKTATSPRFTSAGTWYWGVLMNYNGSDVGWYCRNSSTWYGAWGTPTSDLTVTVTALPDPSSQTAITASSTSINLSWSKDAPGHNVMIVCSTDATFGTPSGGTAYSANTTYGSGATINDGSTNDYVVYNSNGTSCTVTGLSAGTTYYFKFYSENYSYYSSGVTANATTTPSALYYNSTGSVSWSSSNNWQTSTDGIN